MPTIGNCRLCDERGELQRSHVLPAFVYRWMRKTSATGHFRFAHTVNLRAQDGKKRNWFCRSCEATLGKWEQRFADRLFHPYANGRRIRRDYDAWLLKFCVSISWRVLMFHREIDSFEDYDARNRASIKEADIEWKRFLREESMDPGPFSQHLFLCDEVSQAAEHIAPNINRYILRNTDKDIVMIPGKHLVYGKIPRFFFLGILSEDDSSDWHGTNVDSHGGTIPHKQRLPQALYGYANDRSLRLSELVAAMSTRQQAKIHADLEADPLRLVRSDTMRAIERDLNLAKPVGSSKN